MSLGGTVSRAISIGQTLGVTSVSSVVRCEFNRRNEGVAAAKRKDEGVL